MSGEDEKFFLDVPTRSAAIDGYRPTAFIGGSDTNKDGFFGSFQDLSITFEKSPRFWNDYRIVTLSYDSFIGSPQYGYNRVQKTAYGHRLELDDTPGLERINLEHGQGSKVEMTTNGDVLIRSKNNRYELVAGDHGIHVRGNCTIFVGSDADIQVGGDANIEIQGDLSTIVHGDHTHEVRGDYRLYVRGNHEHFTVGNLFQQTRGNVVEYSLSNRTSRTVGSETLEVGGDTKITTQGDTHFSGSGEIQSLFSDGLIDLGGGDLKASNVFMIETHGEYVFVDTAVHAPTIRADNLHGNLEGNATKATYANTAGVAGSGTPIPTTPAPESPDAPDTAPNSEETITDVTGTSNTLITNLDRLPLTGINSLIPDFEEVRSRARNRSLLSNSAWIGDILTNEVVLASITSVPSYKIIDEFDTIKKFIKVAKVVPHEFVEDASNVRRSTRLSPNFTVANLIGRSVLADQVGLTKKEIFEHMQALAMNVLEPLYLKYGSNFSIVEGLYNPYENEKLDANSFVIDKAKGLGVVIQFKSQPIEYLYDVACWIASSGIVAFDRLAISYIDYDPSEENRPSLVITLNETNRFLLSTEYNHQKIADKLLLL